jgi:hypothetical protein
LYYVPQERELSTVLHTLFPAQSVIVGYNSRRFGVRLNRKKQQEGGDFIMVDFLVRQTVQFSLAKSEFFLY